MSASEREYEPAEDNPNYYHIDSLDFIIPITFIGGFLFGTAVTLFTVIALVLTVGGFP